MKLFKYFFYPSVSTSFKVLIENMNITRQFLLIASFFSNFSRQAP